MALADGVANEPPEPVNDEILYRLVQPKYVEPNNGGWEIKSEAFKDRERRISVDRALLSGDPANTQVEESDYICRLVTREVRRLTVTLDAPNGTILERFGICVDPVPLPDNGAHAEIYVERNPTSKAPFRKLKYKLAELAKFEECFGPPPREEQSA